MGWQELPDAIKIKLQCLMLHLRNLRNLIFFIKTCNSKSSWRLQTQSSCTGACAPLRRMNRPRAWGKPGGRGGGWMWRLPGWFRFFATGKFEEKYTTSTNVCCEEIYQSWSGKETSDPDQKQSIFRRIFSSFTWLVWQNKHDVILPESTLCACKKSAGRELFGRTQAPPFFINPTLMATGVPRFLLVLGRGSRVLFDCHFNAVVRSEVYNGGGSWGVRIPSALCLFFATQLPSNPWPALFAGLYTAPQTGQGVH